jgi:uncharacterized protein (TIGR03437 family)
MYFKLSVAILLAQACANAQSLGTITTTGSLSGLRQGHTATLLVSGDVLIAGGFAIQPGWPVFASAELYSPLTGKFRSASGIMTSPRAGHTATLLPDGTVLIVGGEGSYGGATGASSEASAELYDPGTQEFRKTGAMTAPRTDHTATLLNDGRVLIAGGVNSNEKGEQTYLSSAELYDPSTGRFTATGSMKQARSFSSATLLASGKVLISGYFNYSVPDNDDLEHAELYDPTTGTFSLTARAAYPEFELRVASSSLLTSGDVLNTLEDECDPDDLAELYHPSTETFDKIAKTSGIRGYTTTTALPDGKVFLAGQDFSRHESPYASAELYDPLTGQFSTPVPTASEAGHTATLLADGTVLLAGGWICCGQTISSAEIYRPQVLTPPPVLLTVGNSNQGAILHAKTHQVVSPDNPATAGEALEIYLTGLIDGAVIPPQVIVEGHLAEVLYFGKAPGFDHLNQINIRAPGSLAPGPHTASLRLGYLGRTTNVVTIGVSQP